MMDNKSVRNLRFFVKIKLINSASHLPFYKNISRCTVLWTSKNWSVLQFKSLNRNVPSQFSFSDCSNCCSTVAVLLQYCCNKKQNIKFIKKLLTSFFALCPIFLILSTNETLRNSENKSELHLQFTSYHSLISDTEV
jgi:hypothetical protein